MGKLENVLAAILRETSDNNITFADLRYALEALGSEVRVKGDHFICTKQSVAEIVKLPPMRWVVTSRYQRESSCMLDS